jgi:hypothetical protein
MCNTDPPVCAICEAVLVAADWATRTHGQMQFAGYKAKLPGVS